ncbi:MAG: hypothetical protein Q8Q06_00710 [bacterium]|nr:hypothetical protein [bacterium]
MWSKEIQDDAKYKWTNHVKDKMRYYRISPSLVKRIVRHPHRVEEGIAPGTSASMQRTPNKNKPQEIWVMYQEIGQRPISDNSQLSIVYSPKKIISAWRYPGISPLGKQIPIPDDILMELENM